MNEDYHSRFEFPSATALIKVTFENHVKGVLLHTQCESLLTIMSKKNVTFYLISVKTIKHTLVHQQLQNDKVS